MTDTLSLCLFYHLLIPPCCDLNIEARQTPGQPRLVLTHSGLVYFSLEPEEFSPWWISAERRGEVYRERQLWKTLQQDLSKPRPCRRAPQTRLRGKSSHRRSEPWFTLTFGWLAYCDKQNAFVLFEGRMSVESTQWLFREIKNMVDLGH